MEPSYSPDDPLFALVHAVVDVLSYGGESTCTWFYEPAEDRWWLRRESDTLHIRIATIAQGFRRPRSPGDRSDDKFATTCDLWRFATKVRLAASRMKSVTNDYDDPTLIQRSAEYRALCTHLDEHKRLSGYKHSRKA